VSPGQGGLGQSWFVLEFEAAYGSGTETQEQAGGGSQGGFYGPVGRRVRFKAPFTADLARRIEIRAGVSLDAVRQFSAPIPMEMHGAKNFQLHVDVVRQEASLYAQSLREDDELMAVLLAAR
jgi:hypothetical protein